MMCENIKDCSLYQQYIYVNDIEYDEIIRHSGMSVDQKISTLVTSIQKYTKRINDENGLF